MATIAVVKTVVLDANELSRDWLCEGLKYQLLEHMFHATWLNVYVPAVVLEELIANHGRAVTKVEAETVSNAKARPRLGLDPRPAPKSTLDYRAFITERFDDRLGFSVLPWPDVPHDWLVGRAVAHLPPFNAKGSGYRDALIWSDVVALAREGHSVAFVSSDSVFGDSEGNLAPVLKEDISDASGDVELVRDFGSWLLEQLPWKADNLPTAVSTSRDAAFYDYYLKSDFQDDLMPEVTDLGFSVAPYDVVIDEVVWDGAFHSVSEASGPGPLTLVEYDIGQTITFAASFDRPVEPEDDWDVQALSGGGSRVTGTIKMIVRAAVLFGGDYGFSIEELAWARADGRGPGVGVYRPDADPAQLALIELR